MKHSDEELALEVGRRIRRRRLATGLTQERVAELAGLNRTTIGLLEHGERGIQLVTLAFIAGALETTPSDLLEGIEHIPGPTPPRPTGTWSFRAPPKAGG